MDAGKREKDIEQKQNYGQREDRNIISEDKGGRQVDRRDSKRKDR